MRHICAESITRTLPLNAEPKKLGARNFRGKVQRMPLPLTVSQPLRWRPSPPSCATLEERP